MDFLPNKAIRSTDPNETRYVRRAIRSPSNEVVIVFFLALSLLVGGLFLIGDAFVDGGHTVTFIVLGVICVMCGAPWTYSYCKRWWITLGGAPRPVYRVDAGIGEARWQYDEGEYRYWHIGGRRAIFPFHWRRILKKTSVLEFGSSEVVPGLGDEVVLLRTGCLSVSRDVQYGLLWLPSRGRMLVWIFILILGAWGLAARLMDVQAPETLRQTSVVLGRVSAVMGAWVVLDAMRIGWIHRRLRRHIPPPRTRTPLPGE